MSQASHKNLLCLARQTDGARNMQTRNGRNNDRIRPAGRNAGQPETRFSGGVNGVANESPAKQSTERNRT